MKTIVLEVRGREGVVDTLPLKHLDREKYIKYKLEGYRIYGRTVEKGEH